MKRVHPHNFAPPTLRASVVAVMVYVFLWAVWGIWVFCTAKFPTLDAVDPPRMLPMTMLVAASGMHLLLAAWLVVDALRSRSSPPSLRRAHLLGIGLAMLVLVLLQSALAIAHGIPSA